MISHPLLTPEPISAADILADAAERYDRRELSGEQLATIAAALVRAGRDDVNGVERLLGATHRNQHERNYRYGHDSIG